MWRTWSSGVVARCGVWLDYKSSVGSPKRLIRIPFPSCRIIVRGDIPWPRKDSGRATDRPTSRIRPLLPSLRSRRRSGRHRLRPCKGSGRHWRHTSRPPSLGSSRRCPDGDSRHTASCSRHPCLSRDRPGTVTCSSLRCLGAGSRCICPGRSPEPPAPACPRIPPPRRWPRPKRRALVRPESGVATGSLA